MCLFPPPRKSTNIRIGRYTLHQAKIIMAEFSMEQTISSRQSPASPASIAWTHSTLASDNLSDLENVSANWTSGSSDPSNISRRRPRREGCQQPSYGQDELKRQRQFKARHIQMMAFGITPVHFLNCRCRYRNRSIVSIREGAILCWACIIMGCIFCYGYCLVFCIGKSSFSEFISRLPSGRWYLISHYLEEFLL